MPKQIERPIGEMLKRYRQHGNLTMRELALTIGVSAPTLCRVERGDGEPDLTSALKLLSWMFGGGKGAR